MFQKFSYVIFIFHVQVTDRIGDMHGVFKTENIISFLPGMELMLLGRQELNNSSSNLMVDNERITIIGRSADASLPCTMDDLDIDLEVPVVGELGGPTSAVANLDTIHRGDSSAPLSASRLQLLQDTTMIESALDLDSLEDSSVGGGSTAGLIKMNGL
ncbi:Palmitoyltransferase app [Frankliniella fusca]|uniref:Palmitoyltransferase app n=1 Tax=Frankliniella fusca TaxID=407009 RepID=A0AAE1LKK3_9NEOP|nr:Palmitoyltransferase app [Frankliniella fusca]